jgi:hypothetical protein
MVTPHLSSKAVISTKHGAWLVCAVLLLLGLAGCSAFVHSEQPGAADWIDLKGGQSLGQTFVAQYAGLEGVQLNLKPVRPGAGEIVMHLRQDPTATTDLALAKLSIDRVTAARYYSFSFPPLADSAHAYYYAYFEVQGNGVVKVSTAPGNSYLNGGGYLEGNPFDAQLTFNLAYDRLLVARRLGLLALSWSGVLLAGAFLFVVPGWALLAALWPGSASLSWPEKLGLSAGLSLAVYPILLLWTGLVGLRLGAAYAWLPSLAGLAFLAWRAWRRYRKNGLQTHIRLHWQTLLPDLAFILVAGLVSFTRLWAVRDLAAPMWGDSVHHTLIAQLIVDHGGLFNSWQPYADLATLTYHFGFHSAAAVFHWITGLPLSQAVIQTGQLVNILAVIALYPLAVKLGRSRWAGVIAVLFAGLLAPMPMFYVNWGRYTQLTGQVILLASVYLPWALLENERFDAKLAVLSVLALAGMALTHYRLLIFNILFFAAAFALLYRRGSLQALAARIAVIGAGGTLLFLPWFIHLFSGRILTSLGIQITTLPRNASASVFENNQVGALSGYLPLAAWLLLALATAWGLWRRERGAALICLWWGLDLLTANPAWLGLPGTGALTNFAVFIAAYIPAGILLGAGAGWLLAELQCRFDRPASGIDVRGRPIPAVQASKTVFVAAGLLAMFGLGLWGARQRLYDYHPDEGAMVTVPDLRAAEWIRSNTPPGARFLVNSFLAYGGTIAVGSDAGWWLPLLAGRPTTLPPMSYVTEANLDPDAVRKTNELTAQILAEGAAGGEVLKMLANRQVSYVYIGQRGGRVNFAGPVLEPAQLLSSPAFQPVYHQDQVWIFKVNHQP